MDLHFGERGRCTLRLRPVAAEFGLRNRFPPKSAHESSPRWAHGQVVGFPRIAARAARPVFPEAHRRPLRGQRRWGARRLPGSRTHRWWPQSSPAPAATARNCSAAKWSSVLAEAGSMIRTCTQRDACCFHNAPAGAAAAEGCARRIRSGKSSTAKQHQQRISSRSSFPFGEEEQSGCCMRDAEVCAAGHRRRRCLECTQFRREAI